MASSSSSEHAAPLPAPGLLQRVLVASLLDEAGARVVRRAAQLPLAPDARLELVHVSPAWRTAHRRRTPGEVRRALEASLVDAADAGRRAGRPHLELSARAVEGWPAREIVRAAWQTRAELVAVGAPAMRLDGSARATVARLLRWANLPILVVRCDPAGEYQRVLCAVDRFASAADPVELASRLAPGRPLTLFHSYHVPFESWLGRYAPESRAQAVAFLGELVRELGPAAPIRRVVVSRGDPCTQIVRAAELEGAELVVLGTRGRSALARAFSASAAQWVLARASADVAVARRHGLALARG